MEIAVEPLVDRAPDIINASAQSPLAILSLCVLVVGLIGTIFFRKAGVKWRFGAFVLILAGAAGLALLLFSKGSNDNAYASGFSSTSKENDSFEAVSNKFRQEWLEIRPELSSWEVEGEAQKLVDSYVAQRGEYYRGFKKPLDHAGSATKGSSGGKKTAKLTVACPAPGQVIDKSSVSVKGTGGCYEVSINETSAEGLVSQTGKGRSACTLRANCRFAEEYIEGELKREKAALANLAR